MTSVSRPLVGLAVLVLVAACGAPAPSPDPSIPAASAPASEPPSAAPSSPSPPSPSPASSAPVAATDLRLVPAGPAEAFAPSVPPFADGSTLQMTTVAAGPGGWVAGGSDQPDDGNQTLGADAPLWYSVDGRTWERARVEDPDLAGPGSEGIRDVVATDTGWWALGWSYLEQSGSLTRLWSSRDGRAWRTAVLDACTLAVCPDLVGGWLRLRALPDGSVLLAGVASTDEKIVLGWWRIQGTSITAGGSLPWPADLPAATGLYSLAMSDGPDGWALLARVGNYYTSEAFRVLGWTSTDGAQWALVTDGRTDALSGREWIHDVEIAGDRWLVAGEFALVLTGAGGATQVQELTQVNALVRVDDGYVSVGRPTSSPPPDGAPLALWSPDGLEWTPIPIDGDPIEPARALLGAAFDGETLVVVGSRGANAMAWSSGD